MKNNNSQTIIKGFLWNFAGSSMQIMLQLLFVGVLARLLAPKDFGVIGIIMLIVSFTYIFTQLGIGPALVQRKTIEPEHISFGYSFSILIGLIFAAIFYFLAPSISNFFEMGDIKAPIKFFSLFFPIKSFNSVSEALLQRKLKFGVTIKCNTISYIFGFGIVSILLAYNGFGYWALIYGQFIQLVLYSILLAYIEVPKFSIYFRRKTFTELYSFGAGHTLGTFFNYFAENSDNIITGKVLGSTSLGLYSRAFQFLYLPASFFGTIYDSVMFPIISRKQEDKANLKYFYFYSLTFCFLVLIPISLFCTAFGSNIIILLLGSGWEKSIFPFQLLILALSFRFANKINKSFVKAMGMVYIGAYYQFIFSLLILLFCVMGAKFYGISGVALGVLIATIINYFQVTNKLRIELVISLKNMMQFHYRMILFSIPLILIVAILFIINQLFNTSTISFLFSVLVFILLFILIFLRSNNFIFLGQNGKYTLQIINSLPAPFLESIQKTKFYKKIFSEELQYKKLSK